MLFQANTYIFSFKKCKKDRDILKVTLVQSFCLLKTEISRFPIGFRLGTFLRRYFLPQIFDIGFCFCHTSLVKQNKVWHENKSDVFTYVRVYKKIILGNKAFTEV